MDHGLFLGARFFKGHGHGNDYLVFEEGDAWPATSDSVQVVCHRTRGVGGDGIVVLLSPGPGRDGPREEGRGRPREAFRLRMFNPDGTEFERSGNGLRILGAHLFLTGLVDLGRAFGVEVGGDRVSMEILSVDPTEGLNVVVDMGRASFGVDTGKGPEETLKLELPPPAGQAPSVTAHPVRVGNPHCVVFRDGLEEEELLKLGPQLTSHPAFPSGANVQLACVTGGDQVEILIWERGVGRTTSSGTSACAVAAACVRHGHLRPGAIKVIMEGGAFIVSVTEEMKVGLEGPVHPLVRGEMTQEMLESLGG